MHRCWFKKHLISTYIVFILITLGLSSIFIFENIIDTCSVVSAKSIYVDSTGGGHYTTIQAAIDNASSGDTIIVANGTYDESVSINIPNITLIGNSTNNCKIKHHYDGTSDSNFAAGVNITMPGVTIKGFQISVSGSYTFGIRLAAGSSHNSNINNNTIITTGRSGHGIFILKGSNNNILSFNVIKTSGYYGQGIFLMQALNNILNNNTIDTFGSSSQGIYLGQFSDNNNISGNTIHTSDEWCHGISLLEASNNNLIGNTISTKLRGARGISIEQRSKNNNVSDNTIHVSGQDGSNIFLQSASNIIIINNILNVTGKNGYGLYLAFSSYLEIMMNGINATNEGYGIYIYRITDSKFSKNLMTNCCILISGNLLSYWNTHIIDNFNMINNKPVYYYKNISGKVVPENAAQVILANCTYMRVSNQSLDYAGVFLAFTKHSIIKNNTINYCNIQLFSASKNIIIDNTINRPKQYYNGIYLNGISDFNTISNNTIDTYKGYGHGICSSDSSNNNYTKNNINTFNQYSNGINLPGSSNNNIAYNHINLSGSITYGISLDQASKNNLIGNVINIFGGDSNGILLGYCSDNKLMNNNITTTQKGVHGIQVFYANKNNLIANNIQTLGLQARGINLIASNKNDLIENRVVTSGEGGYGIYLDGGSNNKLFGGKINTSGNSANGIYLKESLTNEIINNNIITTGVNGHGVFSMGSNNTHIIKCNITTIGSTAYGIYIESLRVLVINTSISTNQTVGSYDLIASKDGDITSINSSFKTVQLTQNGGGTLKVKNYLSIQVYDDDGITPLPGVDLEVRDNDKPIYASAGYGGYDIPTDDNGCVGYIILMDRSYNHNNSATENITTLKVKKMFDSLWEVTRPDLSMSESHTEIFYHDVTSPPVPTGLKVSRVLGTNTVNISWDLNTDTVAYEIITNRSNSWTNLNFIKHPQNWTFDLNLEEKKWHYYRIQAWDKVGLSSGFSDIVSYYLADSSQPKIPTGLYIEPILNGDALNITWNLNNDNTEHYDLWWIKPESGEWKQLFNISHPLNWCIWSNKSLINGSTYFFKLRAWNKLGKYSAFSPVYSVVHRDYVSPSAPSNLNAELISETKIRLSWSASNDYDVKGYLVYINRSGAGPGGPYALQDKITELDYQFYDLLRNTSYYFVVSAIDEANNTSPYSNEAWNTTISQPLPKRPYILSIIPENNSQDVPVNSSVTIIFSIPMEVGSIAEVLQILPYIDYNLIWTENNTKLCIDFSHNLSYNTNYIITISSAKATTGGKLEDAPVILSFRTELKDNIQPILQTINILSPAENMIVDPGESIKVSGSSTGFSSGTQITVSLGNYTKIGVIGLNGTWLVTITAPINEGNYTIFVLAGNLNKSISIVVMDTQQPQDGDDAKPRFEFNNDLNLLILLAGIVIISIIFIVIGITFIIMRKKQNQVGSVEEYNEIHNYEQYKKDMPYLDSHEVEDYHEQDYNEWEE